MAGGNRFKHRSLAGGLYPDNQQEPANRFYATPPEEPSLLEKALQLAQALGDSSSEYTGKANADPGNRLSPFGAAPTQFIKDSAKHLWDEKFGLVPAKKAWDSGTTLADILSGKEQSTPFASVQGTQLAGDTANNAAIAALDASTLIPGMGIVPKMGRGAGRASAASPNSLADILRPQNERMALDARFNKIKGPANDTPEWASFPNNYDPRIADTPGLPGDWLSSPEGRDYLAQQMRFYPNEPEKALMLARNRSALLHMMEDASFSPPKNAADEYAQGLRAFRETGTPESDALQYMKGHPGEPGAFDPLNPPPSSNADLSGEARGLSESIWNQRTDISPDVKKYTNALVKQKTEPPAPPSATVLPFGKPQSPTTLGMGFPFSGKDGEKPLSRALMDMFKGKPKESPLDQFTPPTTLDDIFTGGVPRGPRELTGGSQNPAGMDGSAFNLNTPDVPYDPAKGFQGLDARLGRNSLPEGVSVIPNPPDLPPSMAGEANYRIALKNGPPVNVRISGRDGRITWEFADQAMPENKVAAGKEAVRRVQDVLAYHSKIAPDQTFYFEGATPAHSKLYDALLGRDSGGYDVSRKPSVGGFEKTVMTPAADKNAKTLSEALAKRAKPPGYDDWSPEWRAAHDKGLDMSQEARMARAREQGFNIDERLYHGTWDNRNMDFDAFDPLYRLGESSQERASWFTPDTKAAGMFAYNDSAGGEQIMPVFVKGNIKKSDMRGKPYSGEEMPWSLRVAEKNGFDGVRFKNMVESKELATTKSGVSPKDSKTLSADQIAIFDPANIRSVNAAFDPANVGKSNLLGAGSPFDSDLIKLLMAYGAFGGMSAGALATMDAQQKAPLANQRGF